MMQNSWLEKKELFYLDKKYSTSRNFLEIKFVSIPIQDNFKNGFGDIQIKLTFGSNNENTSILLNLSHVCNLYYDILLNPDEVKDILDVELREYLVTPVPKEYQGTPVRWEFLDTEDKMVSRLYEHINESKIEFTYLKKDSEKIVNLDFDSGNKSYSISIPFNVYRAFYIILSGFVNNYTLLNQMIPLTILPELTSGITYENNQYKKYSKKTHRVG